MIKDFKLFICKRYNFLLIVFLALILIVSIFSNLGYENINVDQFLWYSRSEQFFSAIKSRNYVDTYQQYHPGVTLMYLIGLGQASYKYFTADLSGFSAISDNNFGTYNFHTKLYVVIFCLVILIYSAYLIYKITGKKSYSYIFLLITFLESYFVGVLRNLHMDGILAVLIFSSVLSFYYSCSIGKSVKYFLLSGFLAGLSYLTKSVSFFVPFICTIIFIYFFFIDKNNRKYLFKFYFVWFLVSVCVFVLLFPAMWVAPLKIITTIIREGVLETGMDGHFRHYMNNTVTDDPGATFYIKVLGFRITPVLQFLLIYFAVNLTLLIKKKKLKDINAFFIFSLFFSVIFFISFMFLKKKTDRYMAPLFPFFSLMGAYSFNDLYKNLLNVKSRKLIRISIVILFAVFTFYNLWNILTIKPYFFAYYNHVLGGIDSAKKEMYINQGGIGVFEIERYIEGLNFSKYPRIAATNESELERVCKYNVEGPLPHLKKEYDIVITPLQRDAFFKWKKHIIKTFKIQGQDYWYVFSDLEL